MELKSSLFYFFEFCSFFDDFLLFHFVLLLTHLLHYSLSFKHQLLPIMLNVLLLVRQTLDNLLSSEDIGTFVSLILLFHFVFFHFIHDLHVVLSDGILDILVDFLFFLFQKLYSSLQFCYVNLLLLANLTRLHDGFEILGLLTDLAKRKIALFVQVCHALFADAADFDRWRMVLL